MKQKLTSALKAALFHLGFFHLLRVLFPNKRVAILRYHAVVQPEKNFYTSLGISVSESEFEAHVRYFAKRYRILSLDEVIDGLVQRKPLPRNTVVFTFDDGYADNFLAARTLKKYGGCGAFYLTTDCIDRKEPLWLVEVNYLVQRARKEFLRLQVLGKDLRLSLADATAKQAAVRSVVKIIKSSDRSVRETVRRQLREQLAEPNARAVMQDLMLSWEQVRQMAEAGMVIGAHTLSHLNLPNADPEDALHEISGSRKVLEERLGKPVRHFSVPNSGPYAYYNDAVKQMVGNSGFVSSVVSAPGFVDEHSDLLELRRVRTVPELHEVIATIELGKFKG
jgi:peptidoglycan/xylan/chitin deacetylase (PgdA/CDA1 family)